MDINKLLTIYCICFGNSRPRLTYQYQKNLMCSAASLAVTEKLKLAENEFLFDDTGKNISFLNYALGDLTGSYWIWKNAQEEFIGTCQYRRFWMDEEITNLSLQDGIIYVPGNPQYRFAPLSAIEQYIGSHGKFGIDVIHHLCSRPNYILKQETFDRLYHIDYITGCNMFFAQNKVYGQVCNVLFEIMFDVFRISIEEIGSFDSYQRRLVAFLSERVLTALVLDAKHYFGNVEVVPVNCVYL